MNESHYELISLLVGVVEADRIGRTYDRTRKVEFQGVLVAEADLPGYHNENVTDSRGTKQRLYRTEDGRHVVAVEEWSHWQGEPNTYALHQVTLAALKLGVVYPDLANAAGLLLPMTLDQALRPEDHQEE